MAKTIALIEVAAPSAGLTATLGAGGSLVVGTTYYYRVVSVRVWNATNVMSVASAEASAICDADNKKITVSWDAVADATHYIVQRTTTSGSYPVNGRNSLHLQGQSSTYVFCTTQLQVIDDGLASSKVEFNAYNFDFSVSYPAISIYADTIAEVITMQEIYAASVAGGWGVVDKICTTAWKAHTGVSFTDQIPYTIRGSLCIGLCTFQLRGALYIDTGSFKVVGGKLRCGSSTYAFMPYIFYNHYFSLYGTTDNATWNGGYVTNGQGLMGANDSEVYGLVQRPVMTNSTSANYPYQASVWYDGMGSGGSTSKYYNSILGLLGANGAPVYDGVYTGTLFEAARPYASNMADVVFTNSQLSYTWRQNNNLIRPTTKFPMVYDCLWGSHYGSQMVDPTFGSKGQTDNQPYWSCVLENRGLLDATMLVKFTLQLSVIDNSGNPIVGAGVTIKDLAGYSDLWENTTRTLSTDATDTSTQFTISSNTGISVNDVLQVEGYAEKVLVTGLVSTNKINVTRGYQGSVARTIKAQYNPRIIRQVASLTTDANGQAIPNEALTGRELVINTQAKTYGVALYEDDHVAAGNLVRNWKTPHTVVISKSGYVTKTIKYTVNKKMTEVEALEQVKNLNFSNRVKVITQ